MTTTSNSRSLVLSLGSNLGDRLYNLRWAVREIGTVVNIVQISDVFETAPMDAPTDSGAFLNLALTAHSNLASIALLQKLRRIETTMGRRRTVRNGPRIIDIDIINYGGETRRSDLLHLPHPRFRQREFVLAPLRTLSFHWFDAAAGKNVTALQGRGEVRRIGTLY